MAGMDVKVDPVTSDNYPTKAKRPSNSRMNKDKLSENGFERLPSWQDALERYLKEITNPLFTLQTHPGNTTPVYHLFVVTVENPEHFLKYMETQGIECNRHYPVPCHLQKAYHHLGYQVGDCPNAEYLASHCATLPLFPEMTKKEQDAVIKACNEYRGM